MNATECARIVSIAYSQFPRFTAQPATLESYFKMLQGFDFKAAEEALYALLEDPNRSDPPTAAQIKAKLYRPTGAKALWKAADDTTAPKLSKRQREELVSKFFASAEVK